MIEQLKDCEQTTSLLSLRAFRVELCSAHFHGKLVIGEASTESLEDVVHIRQIVLE